MTINFNKKFWFKRRSLLLQICNSLWNDVLQRKRFRDMQQLFLWQHSQQEKWCNKDICTHITPVTAKRTTSWHLYHNLSALGQLHWITMQHLLLSLLDPSFQLKNMMTAKDSMMHWWCWQCRKTPKWDPVPASSPYSSAKHCDDCRKCLWNHRTVESWSVSATAMLLDHSQVQRLCNT